MAPSNAAGSHGAFTTVAGLSFSPGDLTTSASLGYSSCQTAAWTSSSSVTCRPPQGEGPSLAVAVAVPAVGTGRALFTFDGSPRSFVVSSQQ